LAKAKSIAENAIERTLSHRTTQSTLTPGPPPDGGIQAWTQVICAWLAILNTWGFVNSFGAFQTYYASILPQTPSTISWIGSTQACLLFALSIFSGRALDAGLFRPTVIIGIAIQLVGIFTMSVSHNYWQLLLTQGICTGIGGGIFFVPTMGIVSTYFAKRRGLALAVVSSGNSMGGVVYPILVRQLLGRIGFGWTVRVLGFVNVVSLAVVIAFMRPRLPPRKTGPIVDMDAFTDIPYLLHIGGMLFIMAPVYFVFYYVGSFARDKLDMSYNASLNLVMIINGAGVPGRIIPGYLADRFTGVINMFILCLMSNLVVSWSWLAIDSIPSYYAYVTIYGILIASFQGLFPSTVAAYSNDITKTGTRLGMAFTVIGFSALVGGPISGALLRAGGGYVAPICWSSASQTVGIGLIVAARVRKHGWRQVKKC
ncbi:MFS general substrate transporter, partial [Aaosphaeria arxii CBS 175.79]